MGCYCAATMAPCSWCENSYECSGCYKIKNKDDDGINFKEEDISAAREHKFVERGGFYKGIIWDGKY